MREVRLSAYCAYVVKIGYPKDAAEAQKVDQMSRQVSRISHVGGLYLLSGPTENLVRLVVTLMVVGCVFSSILVFGLLDLLAKWLKRLPQVQASAPLPAGASLGFWAAALSVLLLAFLYHDDAKNLGVYAAIFVSAVLVLVIILAAFRPLRGRVVTGLLAAGLTLGTAGLLGAVTAVQTHYAIETLRLFSEMMSGEAETQTVFLMSLAAAFLVPMLTAIVLSIVSRVKRVPVSVGLINGFRAVMPPLVCALMLVYGGLTLWTVQQEARANYGLERSLHGEGQYLAQITGHPWPKE